MPIREAHSGLGSLEPQNSEDQWDPRIKGQGPKRGRRAAAQAGQGPGSGRLPDYRNLVGYRWWVLIEVDDNAATIPSLIGASIFICEYIHAYIYMCIYIYI